MVNVWLNRYLKLLAVVTFFLVIAGGLVTSTKSGLSVPDWPLSYGKLMPPMVGGIRFEHTHRIIATLVGLMTLILTFWVGFSEKRKWLRWCGILALGMVVGQGILGGMTVLYLLPPQISVTHACLAQTFFVFMVCLAAATSKWEMAQPANLHQINLSLFKKFLWLTSGLVYAQLMLGATFRHTGNQYVLISHIAGAFFVILHAVFVLVFVFRNLPQEKRFVRPAILLGILTVLQMSLGMGAFIYTVALSGTQAQMTSAHIFFVTSHQTFGALLLATSGLLLLRAHWASRLLEGSF